MQITPDLIKYLESLARIELDETQEAKISAELQDILTYIDLLNELDTDGVEALSHAFPVTNVLRADEVKDSKPNAVILQNAPHQHEGCFVVPKTVE